MFSKGLVNGFGQNVNVFQLFLVLSKIGLN